MWRMVADRQAARGLFILFEGVTGAGGFRARKDKKDKKGQKER
jgi:hypothetical protein